MSTCTVNVNQSAYILVKQYWSPQLTWGEVLGFPHIPTVKEVLSTTVQLLQGKVDFLVLWAYRFLEFLDAIVALWLRQFLLTQVPSPTASLSSALKQAPVIQWYIILHWEVSAHNHQIWIFWAKRLKKPVLSAPSKRQPLAECWPCEASSDDCLGLLVDSNLRSEFALLASKGQVDCR